MVYKKANVRRIADNAVEASRLEAAGYKLEEAAPKEETASEPTPEVIPPKAEAPKPSRSRRRKPAKA